MSKVLGWMAVIIWGVLVIAESIQSGMGMPVPEVSWFDLLIRDWALFIGSAAALSEVTK
jgi:hypothetical protein